MSWSEWQSVIPSLKYYLSSKLYLLMSLLLLNIFTRSIRFYNIHKHSYKTTFLKVQSSCCLAPLLCYHVEYLLCYHVDYLIVLGVVSLSHSRCSNACIPDHLHWYTTYPPLRWARGPMWVWSVACPQTSVPNFPSAFEWLPEFLWGTPLSVLSWAPDRSCFVIRLDTHP